VSAELPLSGIFSTREVLTDANGAYRFDHVPVGPFGIQASDSADPSVALYASAGGFLPNDSAIVTVNAAISATIWGISGRVFAQDGVTGVPNALVFLENLDSANDVMYWVRTVTADAAGAYQTSGIVVQGGDIRASASDDAQNPKSTGLTAGTVTSTAPVTINVTLGNAVDVSGGHYFVLTSADPFQYIVNASGSLQNAGLEGYSLTIDGGTNFPLINAGTLEAGGRQLVLGPAGLGNVTVVRKVFSPSAGGFARILDIFSNPGNGTVTVHVGFTALLGGRQIVVGPAQTNNTFVVTQDSQAFSPAAALVFGGPNARVKAGAVDLGQDNEDLGIFTNTGTIFHTWDVTIPAGGTAILMNFLLQKPALDVAVAQAEAQALANLTDPNALVGMTATDKANVVNFAIQ
jgi:hypothetical protein